MNSKDLFNDRRIIQQIKARGAKTSLEIRIIHSALQTLSLLASISDEKHPKISQLDNSEYKKGQYHMLHNDYQCRLDTIIAGALCPKSEYYDFLNGKVNESPCHEKYFPQFNRPKCWYNI